MHQYQKGEQKLLPFSTRKLPIHQQKGIQKLEEDNLLEEINAEFKSFLFEKIYFSTYVSIFHHDLIQYPIAIIKNSGKLGNIIVAVHPKIPCSLGFNNALIHNSNLLGFPKRLNKGKEPIEYGRKIELSGISELRGMLKSL